MGRYRLAVLAARSRGGCRGPQKRRSSYGAPRRHRDWQSAVFFEVDVRITASGETGLWRALDCLRLAQIKGYLRHQISLGNLFIAEGAWQPAA